MNAENTNRSSFRKFFAYLSFSGFGASLAVHFLSLLGFNLATPYPIVFILHIGVFVVFIPFMFYVYNEPEGKILERGFWGERVFSVMPKKMKYVVYGFFIYTFLNFFLFIAVVPDGSPDLVDGKYVFESNEREENRKVIREISKEEYDRLNAQVVRGFSGHWMLFYIIPTLYFWYSRKSIQLQNNR